MSRKVYNSHEKNIKHLYSSALKYGCRIEQHKPYIMYGSDYCRFRLDLEKLELRAFGFSLPKPNLV